LFTGVSEQRHLFRPLSSDFAAQLACLQVCRSRVTCFNHCCLTLRLNWFVYRCVGAESPVSTIVIWHCGSTGLFTGVSEQSHLFRPLSSDIADQLVCLQLCRSRVTCFDHCCLTLRYDTMTRYIADQLVCLQVCRSRVTCFDHCHLTLQINWLVYRCVGAESPVSTIVVVYTQNTHVRWAELGWCIESCDSLWLAPTSSSFWTLPCAPWCTRHGPSCCHKSRGTCTFSKHIDFVRLSVEIFWQLFHCVSVFIYRLNSMHVSYSNILF